MNRSFEAQPSERLALVIAFLTAVAIVGAALYFILQKAAPMAVPATTQLHAKAVAPPPHVAPDTGNTVQVETANKSTAVYRCIVNGTPTYSDAPCPGGKLVDATPASSGFVPEHRRPTPALQRSEPVAKAAAPAADVTRAARCAWILAEIERLDSMARQPLAASIQDSLRETRRKLVDERYELKC